MPLKGEDVFKALDIDQKKYDEAPEPVKAFVEDFGKEWKRAKDVPDVDAAKGKWNNVLRGRLKKIAKENDLDLEIPDDGDPVDLLGEIPKRLHGKSAAQIADLSEKLKKNAPEEVEKAWGEKYSKVETKLKDTETLLTGLSTKYEDLQKSIEAEKEKMWVDNQWENAASKIEWLQGVSEYEKKGFMADQRPKYRIGKDDKGALRTTDADGNPIQDPTKPAKYKSLDELLIENVKAAKLWKVHEKGGQRVNTVRIETAPQNPLAPQGQRPMRRVMPR